MTQLALPLSFPEPPRLVLHEVERIWWPQCMCCPACGSFYASLELVVYEDQYDRPAGTAWTGRGQCAPGCGHEWIESADGATDD